MMRIVWPWERKKVQRELDSVENMLRSIYTPVPTRPGFISGLRKRLVGRPGPLAKAGVSTLEFILLIGGAVLGLLVFVFTMIRSFIALFAGLRLIGGKTRQRRAKKKELVKEPDKKRAA